jgi:peroxiredoxin
MSIVQDAMLSMMDPGVAPDLKGLEVGDTVTDWTLPLNSGRNVKLFDMLKNGPVLLVFIRGTWCPFCRMHMKRLRGWLEGLQGSKQGTCIVVSTESVEVINAWLDKNPMSYMYASDPEMELGKYFGVYIKPRDFNQAATFLIDRDKTIRLAYRGKRTKKNFEAAEKAWK